LIVGQHDIDLFTPFIIHEKIQKTKVILLKIEPLSTNGHQRILPNYFIWPAKKNPDQIPALYSPFHKYPKGNPSGFRNITISQ